MPVSPARKLAFKILLQSELGRGSTDDLLAPGVPKLDEPDQRLATEIVMGVLRLRGDLDHILSQLADKPISAFDAQVLTALRMGAYQIRWLSRIPKSAAVNESVELTKLARKRSATGLVNAILRKCEPAPARPGEATWNIENPDARECVLRSLPEWLRERWTRAFGESGVLGLAWTSIQRPRMTLRAIGGSLQASLVAEELRAAGISAVPGRYAPGAIVLEAGSHISDLKVIREGRAVIQDEASQAVASLLDANWANRVLDLCAAPGLKTGQIAGEMQGGLLIACERSSRRLKMMKELLESWKLAGPHVMFVQLDASVDLPLATKFDRILLDAPCSGTGTLARNPEIKWRLEPQNFVGYAARQRRMLRNALSSLAPGGRVVYSTCSLEMEENEEVVENVLNDFADCRKLQRDVLASRHPALQSLIEPLGFFRTRPDLHGTDGFFAAVIERKL